MSELTVVRAIGSGRCHVADLTAGDLVPMTFMGSTGYAVGLDPVVTMCGAELKESRGPVVVMTKAEVNCRPCSHLSGIKEIRDRE